VKSRIVHDAVGTDRTVWVYTPPVRAPAQLPVVYFLHGYPGAANDALDAGFADILDEVFASGVTPFIAAFPDANGSRFGDTEWANSADGSQDLDTFLSTALIQAVEGNRIRPRVRRAIAGFSMGGYGAVNVATRHPAQYGQAVSMGGYFKVDDPDGVFGDNTSVQNANSPDQHVSTLAHTRVALFQGQSDGSPPEEGELERFAGLLDTAHIEHLAIRTPGDHSWAWAADQLATMATFLAQGWLTR